MSEEPFILSKRKNSPYYQVRFKNPNSQSTQRYLPAKSTKQAVKSKALAAAWQMYNEVDVKKKSLLEQVRSIDLEDEELLQFLEALKKRGVVKCFVLEQNTEQISAEQFFREFWDLEKSPYIAEKNRMGKHIGLTYICESRRDILKYWVPYFKDKYINEITKRDIKDFVEQLDTEPLGWSRKQKIYRSGATALKWAFNDELLERDVTAGIVSFSGESKKKKILTKEVAELLFSVRWSDEKAELANLVSMLTGMRAGEILALRKQDLGKNCIYVNHSWNRREGLKTPKNGEARVVFFPFENITNKMLDLVAKNPLGDKMDSFIFWAYYCPEHPMDIKKLLTSLQLQLQVIGFPEEEAKQYCFHSWRHFYTANMSDKINQRALQSQTGHKTTVMLEHYSNHQLESDAHNIGNAQIEMFGKIVDKSVF
jgi:integrase